MLSFNWKNVCGYFFIEILRLLANVFLIKNDKQQNSSSTHCWKINLSHYDQKLVIPCIETLF